MKKILSLVLAAVMLISVMLLASCGGTGEADITVGAIYIGSQNEDAGYGNPFDDVCGLLADFEKGVE